MAQSARAALLARLAWLAITLPALLFILRGLPVYDQQLQSVCRAEPCGAAPTAEYFASLAAAGLSPALAAGYKVALNLINLVVCTLVAAVIIWRRPTDRMAWYTAV